MIRVHIVVVLGNGAERAGASHRRAKSDVAGSVEGLKWFVYSVAVNPLVAPVPVAVATRLFDPRVEVLRLSVVLQHRLEENVGVRVADVTVGSGVEGLVSRVCSDARANVGKRFVVGAVRMQASVGRGTVHVGVASPLGF